MNAETPNFEAQAGSPGQGAFVRPGKAEGRIQFLCRQVLHCLTVAMAAFVTYLLASHFIVQSVEVVGMSMYPTLRDSERYLLNRWIYYVRSPRPGDVVVIRDPSDNGLSVKRIIGQPGDLVQLKNAKVYVNCAKLEEPYLSRGMLTFPYSNWKEQTARCGRDEFFLLGDNRMNSADSRTYGPIPRGRILGMVLR